MADIWHRVDINENIVIQKFLTANYSIKIMSANVAKGNSGNTSNLGQKQSMNMHLNL